MLKKHDSYIINIVLAGERIPAALREEERRGQEMIKGFKMKLYPGMEAEYEKGITGSGRK